MYANPKKIAKITVSFKRKLNDKDLQEIENKLRKFEEVGGFSQKPHKISFSIWSQNEIDYRIIDALKKFLKEKQQRIPKITAVEYVLKKRRSF
ncbi:MAG: hypothetical protein AMJ95_06715 [Omnitrophica WOR_2 bacterium SM23_72]|nr:MAG: hypothetical protein AMJ95_06715 [Omnitrophica WOR_2 bacterium SM23_72]